eukprot:624777-Ditylum_brightwellii.AAC.1
MGSSVNHTMMSTAVEETENPPEKINNKANHPTSPDTDEVEEVKSTDKTDGMSYKNQHGEAGLFKCYPKEGVTIESPLYESVEEADKA